MGCETAWTPFLSASTPNTGSVDYAHPLPLYPHLATFTEARSS